MAILNAPWKKEEVANLEKWQANEAVHPYTCGNNSRHILKPTENGWVCPKCSYTQNWCHAFSALTPPPVSDELKKFMEAVKTIVNVPKPKKRKPKKKGG